MLNGHVREQPQLIEEWETIMAITAKAVAERAGVSLSTVSRALAGAEYVNERTRDRVMEAATSLGYIPNPGFRSVTGASASIMNIGLALPDLSNPYLVGVAKAILERSRKHDVSVLIVDTDEDQPNECTMIKRLASQVDGLILCSPRMTDEDLASIVQSENVVLVNRQQPGASSVSGDLRDGYYQAVAHLAALGHSRIAYASGWRTSSSGSQRLEGLQDATRDLGIEFVDVGNFSPDHEGGHTAADRALATGATATICYNDMMAIGMMSRLQSRGLSVPTDMSIVGCDDVAFAKMSTPTLTSISVSHLSLGRTAVDLLTNRLQNPDTAAAAVMLPALLIIRDSISAPGQPL